ncbi:MAG: hypothetical protein KA419_03780 [Acidobacteria bacterium]|nr:hypothetical protein [Acidobacteriota bacterium]
MKRIFTTLALLLPLVLLTGCYDSPVPLSAPALPVDARLPGNWIQTAPADAPNAYRLVIRKYSEREYLVLFSEGDASPSVARGYLTDVSGVRMMNLQNIDSAEPKDRDFIFFRYDVEPGGGLRVRILSDDHPALHDRRFATAAQLRAVVARHLKEDNLFGPPLVFTPAPDVGLALARKEK